MCGGLNFFQSGCCSETSWALVCWWEAVSDCICIPYLCSFSSPTKVTLSQPMRFFFFRFTLLILSPVLLEGSEQATGGGFAAGWDQPTTLPLSHLAPQYQQLLTEYNDPLISKYSAPGRGEMQERGRWCRALSASQQEKSNKKWLIKIAILIKQNKKRNIDSE